MKVLVACEFSGTVRDAFREMGHDAVSADILPSERPGPHYQGDVLDLLLEPFDLVIAHPPCTYLSNAGVCFLSDPGRWENMEKGASFFWAMSQFNSPRIAIENPVQHRHAKKAHGLGNQTQIIHPWQHGHTETKPTCLWLFGLPPLQPTDIVKEEMDALHPRDRRRLSYLPPSPDRWKLRSTTYSGIAQAMAQQWGALL